MKLIVGLGNPGKEYEGTRHNCGYAVVDQLADILSVDINKEDFQGVYGKFKLDDEDVFLLKPLTYMNNSGKSVQELAHFFKISTEDIVVCFDDMALKPGSIRLRKDGSSGGQKGMQSIIDCMGTQKIKRVRIGIGEPKFNSIDYVLGKPNKEEKLSIDIAVRRAADALIEYLNKGFDTAMSKFNGGEKS